MSEKSKRVNGIIVKPKTEAPTIEGEVVVDSADNKVKVYLDSSERAVVTEDQTATFTNKTHTDPILNGDVTGTAIDTDDTLSADSDTKIPSQQAVKAYVDNAVNTVDDASEITYTPAVDTDWDGDVDPGNVDAALDQLAERVDDNESSITTNASNLSDHLTDASDAHDASAISNVPSGNLGATDLQGAVNELQSDIDTRALDSDLTETDTNTDDLITLSGVPENSTDLGTFTGTTITDNVTVKAAIQELETAVESSGLPAHEADTSTHGVTEILGSSETQTVTNKDIDGGTASNTSRITLPKDTKANLDALTRKQGTIVYSSDEDKGYLDDGSSLIELASSTFTPPTVQKFTSGSGTYTTPANVKYIKVKMVGAGGGGSGGSSISPSTSATAGSNSTFGTSLLIAGGGGAGVYVGSNGSVANTINSPAIEVVNVTGQNGGSGDLPNTGDYSLNGYGGSSYLGGGAPNVVAAVGANAIANTGSGGSGGATNAGTGGFVGGSGGGAGSYLEAIITSPSASYSYTVGVGGAGSAGQGTGLAGGAGASGQIIVEEYY